MRSQSESGSSRRVFLAQTSGIASLGAAPWIGRAAAAANDRIGLIGVGGRGSDHRKVTDGHLFIGNNLRRCKDRV